MKILIAPSHRKFSPAFDIIITCGLPLLPLGRSASGARCDDGIVCRTTLHRGHPFGFHRLQSIAGRMAEKLLGATRGFCKSFEMRRRQGQAVSAKNAIMKERMLLAILLLFSLISCGHTHFYDAVQDTGARRAAIESARLRNDHDALSRYFEDLAREMQGKAREKKQLLDHYESKSYLYGRRAENLKSHTEAGVRRYENIARRSLREADAHRRLACESARQSGRNRTIDASCHESAYN